MVLPRSLRGGVAAFTANRLGRPTACILERKFRPSGPPLPCYIWLRPHSFLAPTKSLQLAHPQDPMDSGDTSTSNVMASLRRSALHKSLQQMHMDPDTLSEANSKNLLQPTRGYDPTFGRAAIRCYRSFLKDNNEDDMVTHDPGRLAAAADRCARQIDHLRRRHLAQHLDWVRNHDSQEKMTHGQQQQQATIPARRFPIVMVLDNLRSAFNVGSLFRTAEACAIQELITTGITAHPNGGGAEKLSKSALGAETLVPTRHFDTTRGALDWLQQAEEYRGWTMIGMETTANSVDYTQMEYSPTGCILVFGNEVTGIDPALLQDPQMVLCQIPMFGAKNSLNVAACAPVVLYEIIRQWSRPNSDSG